MDSREKFRLAAVKRDVASMKEAIDEGLRIDEPDASGLSLLAEAAGRGLDEAVSLLIDAGAGVNATSGRQKGTALIGAAQGGYPGIVRRLIAAGADVNLCDKHFTTPLNLAVNHDSGDCAPYVKIVDMLIAAGADVNGGRHFTVLMHAARGGLPEMVRSLVRGGADVNLLRPQGTALILAVRENKAENVEALLQLGADKSLRAPADSPVKDIAGKTALELAVAKGFKPIIALLGGE